MIIAQVGNAEKAEKNGNRNDAFKFLNSNTKYVMNRFGET